MTRLGSGGWRKSGALHAVGCPPEASAASRCVPQGPRWAVGSCICTCLTLGAQTGTLLLFVLAVGKALAYPFRTLIYFRF